MFNLFRSAFVLRTFATIGVIQDGSTDDHPILNTHGNGKSSLWTSKRTNRSPRLIPNATASNSFIQFEFPYYWNKVISVLSPTDKAVGIPWAIQMPLEEPEAKLYQRTRSHSSLHTLQGKFFPQTVKPIHFRPREVIPTQLISIKLKASLNKRSSVIPNLVVPCKKSERQEKVIFSPTNRET